MDVEIRQAAGPEDRRASAALGTIAFGREGDSALVSLATRLKSSRRAQATTWLACVDGIAVATLLAYDLTLRRGDERRPCFGLGSVATHPEYRKRGCFASYILRDSGSKVGRYANDFCVRTV